MVEGCVGWWEEAVELRHRALVTARSTIATTHGARRRGGGGFGDVDGTLMGMVSPDWGAIWVTILTAAGFLSKRVQ